MATYTCQTERWVDTSPYVKLTVEESSSAASVILTYRLYYISDFGANTDVSKPYEIKIGSEKITGTYDINKKTGTNLIRSGSVLIDKTKATQKITCSCTFAFALSWSSMYCGSKTAKTTINIAAKEKYPITYNANGGTGAPATQYKWFGESLLLSSTKPTRVGHTFKGWMGSNGYTYQPGASWEGNDELELSAIWEPVTYLVAYDANGGTGAPASQTKTYGKNLTLTTSISNLKRTNYAFKGWATTPNGAVSYKAGGVYTANAAITLYAVWELSYVLPKIYNTKAEWVADQGDSVSIEFDWETTNSNPTANLVFNDASGSAVHTVSLGQLSGKSGQFERTISTAESNTLNIDTSYVIKITLSDGGGDTTSAVTLTGNVYAIDFLNGGMGVSFGGPASLKDTAHFQWAAKFDKPVHGMVRGLGKLPKIEPGSDFNDYMDFGVWAVYGNADSLEINNMPPLYYYSDTVGSMWVGRAGILEVYSPTGEGMRSAEWSYVRQRFIPYSLSFPIMERDITRNASNVWNYGGWYKTSLIPKDEPVTLYSSEIGATGTITLSQTSANFEYLEIFFTDNNGELGGYTKIHKPYNKVVNLSVIEAGGTTTHIRRTSYTISGATMTPDTTNAGFVKLTDTAVSHTTGTNYIKITRVVGRNS